MHALKISQPNNKPTIRHGKIKSGTNQRRIHKFMKKRRDKIPD